MKKFLKLKTKNSAFTLLELLIVIAILAILAVIAVVVLNPQQLIKESNDSKRFTEIESLDKAVAQYLLYGGSFSGLTPNAAYVSVVNGQCPTGPQYRCPVADANANLLQKVDATGWIPLHFDTLAGGSPLTTLPIDPKNDSANGFYYTFSIGSDLKSYEFNAVPESQKYRLSGINDKVSSDGGDNYAIYERGNNLTVSPISDSGIVGYWKFDEGSGGTAKDSSGNGHTGTFKTSGVPGTICVPPGSGDCPQWTDGETGKAVDFTNTGDTNRYISVDNNNVWNSLPISMSAWSKISGVSSGIIGHITGSNGIQVYQQSSPGHPTGYYGVDATNYTLAYPLTIGDPDNKWHHYVYTADSTGSNLYYDGQLVKSSGWNGSFGQATTTANLLIGSLDGTYYMKGVIDDVRVYNCALSATEVKSIYDATK